MSRSKETRVPLPLSGVSCDRAVLQNPVEGLAEAAHKAAHATAGSR
jgi:hypothetical protein